MSITAAGRETTSEEDRMWYRRARRWTQLTFVEDDPLHFDREFWVDVMTRTRSTGACISAGGYVAYYPSKIPFHYTSKFLGDMDLFGMVNEDARRLDMNVMARIDPHAVHADAAEAHPEWIARDEEGNAMEHWAYPDIWLTCPFSTYYSEFIVDITREIVREYDVDAVFANRWEGSSSISYSEGARKLYFDATGNQLPVGADRRTRAWAEYFAWRSDQLSRQIVAWDEATRSVNPRSSFIPNRGARMVRDLNSELVKGMYPAFFIDKQGRSPREAIWAAGRVGKRARGVFPDRPVSLISSVGPENHQHRWKDSVASGAELQAWIVDGFVHGATPWFTKFNARVPDARWVEPIAHAFGLHEKAEALYGTKTPTARVAIFDAITPAGADSPTGGYMSEDSSEDGLCQALLEARIPFEYIDGDALTDRRIHQFTVVVVPGSVDLSVDHIAVLGDFLGAGGRLLADSEAVLDSDGTANGLAGLLGVRVTGDIRRGVQNNYAAIVDPTHPSATAFAGTERILGGTSIVPVEAESWTSVPFRFIPDFPDLPMEEVYPREAPRDPAVVLGEHDNGGRTAFVAFDLPALFWEALQVDHGELIGGLVRWLLDGDEPVTVVGQGLVDIAVRSSDEGVAVSIVNLDNPKAMRGQLRSSTPIGTQTISIALPADTSTASVRTLTEPGFTSVDAVDGRVTFDVPGVDLLEVVEVAWTSPLVRGALAGVES
ncbi:family 10 glycosylhydrolase [Rhodococcoides fascians]|uniref:family 10 glycosylhydrolase n=1 Tax=Rhodococcoides fascians TaxID=1828 RepID=UPI0014825EAB|nr:MULTISPECIES: family 10 glycosylhydrolase [Rhodococcus]